MATTIVTSPITTITTTMGDPRRSYGDLYPLISGIILWSIIIITFIICRQMCMTCYKKCQKLTDRLSFFLGNTRPFSHCWTYTPTPPDSENGISRENSLEDYDGPPRYSIALDMPKPEDVELRDLSSLEQQHHIFNEARTANDTSSQNNVNPQSETENSYHAINIEQEAVEEEPPYTSLHRAETDPDLPKYEDAIRQMEESNIDLEIIAEMGSIGEGHINRAFIDGESSDSASVHEGPITVSCDINTVSHNGPIKTTVINTDDDTSLTETQFNDHTTTADNSSTNFELNEDFTETQDNSSRSSTTDSRDVNTCNDEQVVTEPSLSSSASANSLTAIEMEIHV